MSYNLTKIAENDLLQIKYCSAEVFWQEIARKYLIQIHNRCIEICNFPNIGINRPEIFKNIKSIIFNSNIILYFVIENEISILRMCIKI
ncbi:Toxin of toxin-antitoxin (TA) system ParE [Rickettsia akari str. Hartford]|uniref:Toxin of toxin-antitoxin (TA) system ParE n=1 Tax=Rickettsia akari (strain Hartford) TaxID=293614 RepID=A8GM95_RICAH|nr:type II toxin-antitoxin system RelE/ParE family toxin [Rickettsia akari]ABV74520.1 Toxin of toxin-antitoxin (TA) system ParE [Rickettsia akari str. Hartford]